MNEDERWVNMSEYVQNYWSTGVFPQNDLYEGMIIQRMLRKREKTFLHLWTHNLADCAAHGLQQQKTTLGSTPVM